MLKTVTNSINASQIQTPITLPGDVTLSNGNLVIGTSGKGIDFSATPNTGTSELFADYEEGTWTAQLGGSTTNPTTPITSTGKYTRVGRQVTVTFDLSGNTTGGSGFVLIIGLPYTIGAGSNYYSSLVLSNLGTDAPSSYGAGGNGYFALLGQTTGNYITLSAGAGRGVSGTFTYFV
jgi:hypothetical protein